MDITSAQYIADPKTNENRGIWINVNGENWGVPIDPANTYYAEIMRQVNAGELTIEPADEPE